MEALLDFLAAVGRLPMCGGALRLRDGLLEARFRREQAHGALAGNLNRMRGVRRAGAELVASAKTSPAIAAGAAAAIAAQAEADAERTRTLMLRPRPGGRVAAPRPAPALPASTPTSTDAVRRDALRGSGLNAIVDAATPLLTAAAAFRRQPPPADLRALRADVARQVAAFDAAVRGAAVAAEHALAARYLLCTFVDEAVLTTPWGGDSPWARHSLLSQFHDETWGGEKCFEIVERLLADPPRHRPLLEFALVCLALGLQGRHGIGDGGAATLRDLRTRVHDAVRRARGPLPRELSPHARAAVGRRARVARLLPLWVVASFAALGLLTAYAAFGLALSQPAEDVQSRLARIGAGPAETVAPSQPAAAPAPLPAAPRAPTLRDALADDIRAGVVDVIEQPAGSTIEIRGDGLFASGSAQLEAATLPVLLRIAAALDRFDAPVRIAGHTDDQPIAIGRRLRFASNRELSQARADAVAAVVAPRLAQPSRVSSEGRGDAEPRVANDSAAHRASNRRVDITLLGAAAVLASAEVAPPDAAVARSMPTAATPPAAGRRAPETAAGDRKRPS